MTLSIFGRVFYFCPDPTSLCPRACSVICATSSYGVRHNLSNDSSN